MNAEQIQVLRNPAPLSLTQSESMMLRSILRYTLAHLLSDIYEIGICVQGSTIERVLAERASFTADLIERIQQ